MECFAKMERFASRSICPLEAGGRLVSRGVRRVDHAHTAWIVAR